MQKRFFFFWPALFVFLLLLAVRVSEHADSRMGQQLRTRHLQVVARPDDYKEHLLTNDGRERSYLVHVPPAYQAGTSLPLVIILHGGGGNAKSAMKMTGMSIKADKEGFIAVYPNGTGRLKNRLLTWNAGHCCGYAFEKEIDDVGFIRALIENLQRQFHIDPNRIYAAGMSNGAMMTYRLGCEISEKIAAIAPVAGALGSETCRPESPLSVIIFHGTADEHVLFEGGKPHKSLGRPERIDKAVSYAVSFWVKHNGCSAVPQKQENGNIVHETYLAGRNGAEVVLYTIKGGGHAWPGGRRGRLQGDEPTQEISATDLMWDFFIRHPKR